MQKIKQYADGIQLVGRQFISKDFLKIAFIVLQNLKDLSLPQTPVQKIWQYSDGIQFVGRKFKDFLQIGTSIQGFSTNRLHSLTKSQGPFPSANISAEDITTFWWKTVRGKSIHFKGFSSNRLHSKQIVDEGSKKAQKERLLSYKILITLIYIECIGNQLVSKIALRTPYFILVS